MKINSISPHVLFPTTHLDNPCFESIRRATNATLATVTSANHSRRKNKLISKLTTKISVFLKST